MRNDPLVSISMPAFNAGSYIAESIESILAQTYKNFELIIYDDGSTDNTREIILRYFDPRIRTIFSNENLGLITARNTIAQEARGKYLALLDADDVAVPERLEIQVAFMELNECDLCGSDYWTKNEKTGQLKRSKQRSSDADLKALLTIASPFCNPTIMGKLQLFQKLPYLTENKHAEDYAFFILAALAGYRFCNIKKRLLYYRLHNSQVSVIQSPAAKQVFKKMQTYYLMEMDIIGTQDFYPRATSFANRLKLAIPFMLKLNKKISGVSVMVNYEIYARFQYRGNGLLTPFIRLERLLVALLGSIKGR